MPLFDAVVIILAGMAAGAINALVGSGTLITFPALVMLGYPPLAANMTNSVGLLPGGLAGAWGYRRELAGKGPLLRRLVPLSVAGGIVGALLLLVLPSSVFDAVVPVLVALGIVLVVLGPWLNRRTAAVHDAHTAGVVRRLVPMSAYVACFLTGIYGGYFGAAQGVILVGVLSVVMTQTLQEINGMKNVIVPLVNLVAGVIFVVLRWSDIDWWAALAIGVGSAVGGLLGASLGRRLPPAGLRAVIVVVGTVALWRLVTT